MLQKLLLVFIAIGAVSCEENMCPIFSIFDNNATLFNDLQGTFLKILAIGTSPVAPCQKQTFTVGSNNLINHGYFQSPTWCLHLDDCIATTEYQECSLTPLTPVTPGTLPTPERNKIKLVKKIGEGENLCLVYSYCRVSEEDTHAINDKNLYLINPLLLTNEEDTNILKTNVKYSNLFGVLINQDMSSTKLDVTNKDNDSTRIKNLTQHFRDAIQQEINETNDRITKFNEEQFRLLNLFREKAEQEFNSLVRIIKTVPEQSTNSNVAEQLAGPKLTNFDTPPPTPDSTPMSIGNSPNFKHQPRIVTEKQQAFPAATKNGSTRTASTQPTAKATDDSIFFFEMDGIPNAKRPNQYTNAMSDVEESDTDDSVTDVDTSHQRYAGRPKSLNIAQSLPVSMPVIAMNRDVVHADYDEYSDENIDIAASIKAIAKSVHGEGVFGDLPRPRFSTQI